MSRRARDSSDELANFLANFSCLGWSPAVTGQPRLSAPTARPPSSSRSASGFSVLSQCPPSTSCRNTRPLRRPRRPYSLNVTAIQHARRRGLHEVDGHARGRVLDHVPGVGAEVVAQVPPPSRPGRAATPTPPPRPVARSTPSTPPPSANTPRPRPRPPPRRGSRRVRDGGAAPPSIRHAPPSGRPVPGAESMIQKLRGHRRGPASVDQRHLAAERMAEHGAGGAAQSRPPRPPGRPRRPRSCGAPGAASGRARGGRPA